MLVLGAAVLAGCRTDVTVSVSQRLDGAGRVTVRAVLDRDAASKAGDLNTLVRLGDLQARGWQVVGPAPLPPGGRVEFRAEKAVSSPEQAQAALAEISGTDGPFGRLRVTRARSVVAVRSSVSGPVDLRGGYPAFGDELLARQLSSSTALGVDPQEVLRQYGHPIEELVPLHLEVAVPGRAITYDLVPGQSLDVAVSSTTWNVRLGLAVLAFVVAVGLWLALIRARRRPR